MHYDLAKTLLKGCIEIQTACYAKQYLFFFIKLGDLTLTTKYW